MRGYIIKRLLWFIPTLFMITLLGFVLLVNSPGDPLDLLVNPLNTRQGSEDMEVQKTFWRKQLGLDLPLFYFSVTQLAEPDTLYKIHDKAKLSAYKALLEQSGNASSINEYLLQLHKTALLFNKETTSLNADADHIYNKEDKELINSMNVALQALKYQTDVEAVQSNIKIVNELSGIISPGFSLQAKKLSEVFQSFLDSKTTYKNYIPKVAWHGFNNRYHQWLFGGISSKGIIRGDFGISYIKKEPVIAIIKDKIVWSLFFSVVSIILAFIISIPIGIRLANNPASKGSRLTQAFLFMLYAMPSFFAGVLLLMLFANPDVLSLFPPSGIKPIGGYDEGAGLFEKLYESLPYIILPLICYTYSSLAFISKLTQTSVSEQLGLDYIKTAKAKGLTDREIIWKHAFKNSLLPLITVFSTVFPSIIGGSVIIETIFTIPGMGLETVKAIIAKDYPIVIAVITFSSILTMFSYLMADVLYAWVDPRIKYK